MSPLHINVNSMININDFKTVIFHGYTCPYFLSVQVIQLYIGNIPVAFKFIHLALIF